MYCSESYQGFEVVSGAESGLGVISTGVMLILFFYFWFSGSSSSSSSTSSKKRLIYLIFHETYDGTNVVTLDAKRIPMIVDSLTKKYNDPSSEGQWRYRVISEEEEFDADLDYGGRDETIKVKME